MDKTWNVFCDGIGFFRNGTTEQRARQAFTQLCDQEEAEKIELVHGEQTVVRRDF